MILRLMLRGLARGKARFACAALGVAAACGAVVFMFSLAATNAAQAPALAKRATEPWSAWTIDGAFGRGRPAQNAAKSSRTVPCRPDLRMDLVGCANRRSR